jgi:hypothetical protein
MRLSFNLIKWNAFDNTPNVIWLARYRHDSSKILFMWSTYNFSRIPFDNIMFFTFPILFLIVVVFIFITMRYSKLSKQLFNLKLKTRVGNKLSCRIRDRCRGSVMYLYCCFIYACSIKHINCSVVTLPCFVCLSLGSDHCAPACNEIKSKNTPILVYCVYICLHVVLILYSVLKYTWLYHYSWYII